MSNFWTSWKAPVLGIVLALIFIWISACCFSLGEAFGKVKKAYDEEQKDEPEFEFGGGFGATDDPPSPEVWKDLGDGVIHLENGVNPKTEPWYLEWMYYSATWTFRGDTVMEVVNGTIPQMGGHNGNDLSHLKSFVPPEKITIKRADKKLPTMRFKGDLLIIEWEGE